MDLTKLGQLLNVLERLRNLPTLKPLHDWVLLELEKLTAQHVAEQQNADQREKEVPNATRYPERIRPGVPSGGNQQPPSVPGA